jgi:hypothetical protein
MPESDSPPSVAEVLSECTLRLRNRLAADVQNAQAPLNAGLVAARYLESNLAVIADGHDEFHDNYRHSQSRLAHFFETEALIKVLGHHFHTEALERLLPTESRKPRSEALLLIQGHALLVQQEVSALLRASYPHGAQAHYRTLYELTVVARLLGKRGQKLASRYLSSKWVDWNRIIVREWGSPRRWTAGMRSVAEEVHHKADTALRLHGDDLDSKNGWARPLFPKGRITFEMLEQKAGHSRFRSLYRESSHVVHPSAYGHSVVLSGPQSRANYITPRGEPGLAAPTAINTILDTLEIAKLLSDQSKGEPTRDEILAWYECLYQVCLAGIHRLAPFAPPKISVSIALTLLWRDGLDVP